MIVGEHKAAQILGLRVQTLRNWRHLRKGPAYIKVGGRAVRYRLDDLTIWLDRRRVDPEADRPHR